MKKYILTIVVMSIMGIACAQPRSVKGVMVGVKAAIGVSQQKNSIRQIQAQQTSKLISTMPSNLSVSIAPKTLTNLPNSTPYEIKPVSLSSRLVELSAIPIIEDRKCSCGSELEWSAMAYKEYTSCNLCKGKRTYDNKTCTLCKESNNDYVWKSGYVCKKCGKLYKD